MSSFTDWLRSHLQDYGQLVEPGTPLNNQYQQLKSNVNQNVPPTAAFRDPSQLAEWSQAAALNAPNIGAIKAWHGSPHKFTQFKDEAIGTGEGAQAFGMGHYSGEDVNALDSHYRKRLSGGETPKLADWKMKYANDDLLSNIQDKHSQFINDNFPNDFTPDKLRQESFKRTMSDVNMAHMFISLDPKKPFNDTGLSEHLKPLYDNMQDYFVNSNKGKGFMYELNLKPDPEDLLHFDKKLSDHPQEIQDKIQETAKAMNIRPSFMKDDTGRDVYNYLAARHPDMDEHKMSKLLKEFGIPGHSFPGQGGQGKPNYVMYDPKDIEIKRRIKGGLDSPVKGFVDYIKGKKD
jgi:hypothetical protein